ncbi:hypothetical protein [Pseudolysinimonas sp.]|uniref:hypothetical protein n=1 Tax=Pseudolysinimonas sp. TaxID=2680009 RepID=UPI003F803205
MTAGASEAAEEAALGAAAVVLGAAIAVVILAAQLSRRIFGRGSRAALPLSRGPELSVGIRR